MNARTVPICSPVAMNAKLVALMAPVRPSRVAVSASGRTGHSLRRPSRLCHAGISRMAMTSRASWARHGVPALIGVGRRYRRARRSSRSVVGSAGPLPSAKVGRGDRVGRPPPRWPVRRPPRRVQKGAGIGRGDVSLVRPSLLSAGGRVVQQLFRFHRQFVQPVDFSHRVRQASTAPHHRVKEGELVVRKGRSRALASERRKLSSAIPRDDNR